VDGVELPLYPAAEYRPASEQLFGDRLSLAAKYAKLLATEGIVRGLIGPREAPRIWERHLLNCAAIAELVPQGVEVLDVGSGAGLPGLVLAIARPDLRLTLIEPLLRREQFLLDAVRELDLDSVTVDRVRAEAAVGKYHPQVVTARAVAPLHRLLDWSLPFLGRGGRLLAIKGESAQREIVEASSAIRKHKAHGVRVVTCGDGTVIPPVMVVEVTK